MGLGSGVIVSPDGFILTNNHVVEDADELTVDLSDGRKYTAKVVGADPKTDIAVVKIEATGLSAVTFADSDKLRVGDVVFAVGQPPRRRRDGHDGNRLGQGPQAGWASSTTSGATRISSRRTPRSTWATRAAP